MNGILLLKNMVPFIVEIDKNMHISIRKATDIKFAFYSYINIKNLSKNIAPLSGNTNCESNLKIIQKNYICTHKIIDRKMHTIPIISFPINTSGFTFSIFNSILKS
jgi:hypothetical protein